MAYNFTASSSQYLTTAAAPVVDGNQPMSFSCWFRTSDTTTNQTILYLGPNTGSPGDHRYSIAAAGAVTNDPIRFTIISNGSGPTVDSVAYVANTWYHVCGVSANISTHTLYVNGTSYGGAGVGFSIPNFTSANATLAIGARYLNGTWLQYANADIADVGVWRAALNASEALALARGACCSLVRPQSLVFYSPLIRDLTDIARSRTITNNNTATVSNHPRIYT